jgi:anti-sigma regulatory factor (Ser/Thr protein kinase)
MSTTRRTSLTVTAQPGSVARFTDFVAECAAAAGFSPDRVREIELVVEEVLMNICRHAYGDAAGEVELRCAQSDSGQLLMEFIDNGKPFNILTSPAPDLAADVDEREVGGLGIPLIRAMMDQVTYRREGDRNILRLTAQLAH